MCVCPLYTYVNLQHRRIASAGPRGKEQDDGVDAGPRGMMNGFGACEATGADLSDHINSRRYLLWGFLRADLSRQMVSESYFGRDKPIR